jgi:hypothetical protein
MPCDLRKLSSVLVARFPRSSLTTQGSLVRTQHRPPKDQVREDALYLHL